jgi:hypothetical protein
VPLAYAMWGVLGILVLTLGIMLGGTYMVPKVTEPPAERVVKIAEPKPDVDRIAREKARRKKAKRKEAAREKEAEREAAAKKKRAADAAAEAKRIEEERLEAEVLRRAAEKLLKQADEKRRADKAKDDARRKKERMDREKKDREETYRRESIWTLAKIQHVGKLVHQLNVSISTKVALYELQSDAERVSTKKTKGVVYLEMKVAAHIFLTAYNKQASTSARKTVRDL